MALSGVSGVIATSVADLVEVTKLKPGSLYAAFQSKEDLFLTALDHYGQQSVTRVEQLLSKADSPLEGIRRYFRQLAKEAANPKAKRSCFLVNTVLELARQNPAVKSCVNRHLGSIEELFRHTLEAAQAARELAGDKDPSALAAFLMSNIWSIRVLSGTAPTPQRTRAVVNQLLQLLGQLLYFTRSLRNETKRMLLLLTRQLNA